MACPHLFSPSPTLSFVTVAESHALDQARGGSNQGPVFFETLVIATKFLRSSFAHPFLFFARNLSIGRSKTPQNKFIRAVRRSS